MLEAREYCLEVHVIQVGVVKEPEKGGEERENGNECPTAILATASISRLRFPRSEMSKAISFSPLWLNSC